MSNCEMNSIAARFQATTSSPLVARCAKAIAALDSAEAALHLIYGAGAGSAMNATAFVVELLHRHYDEGRRDGKLEETAAALCAPAERYVELVRADIVRWLAGHPEHRN